MLANKISQNYFLNDKRDKNLKSKRFTCRKSHAVHPHFKFKKCNLLLASRLLTILNAVACVVDPHFLSSARWEIPKNIIDKAFPMKAKSYAITHRSLITRGLPKEKWDGQKLSQHWLIEELLSISGWFTSMPALKLGWYDNKAKIEAIKEKFFNKNAVNLKLQSDWSEDMHNRKSLLLLTETVLCFIILLLSFFYWTICCSFRFQIVQDFCL